MKKVLIAAVVLLMTAVSFGQKKELKKAKKAIKSGDYAAAMTQINAAEGLVSNADNSVKSDFYTTKALALTGAANKDFAKMKLAAAAYEKAVALNGKMTPELKSGIAELRAGLVNSAVEDQNNNRNKLAAEKLYTSYSISKKDTSDLFFAASNAVNGKDYPTALKYYQMLLDLEYTGRTTTFVATNKGTGELKEFSTKTERDLLVKAGEYIKPEQKIGASKEGEILRTMTLIYLDSGEDDKAKALFKEARAKNPNDVGLMRAEANMAYKLKDFDSYNRIMKQVVATDPTNPELYFNLGVGAAGSGQNDKAVEYYQKALELNPDYRLALINLAALKLGEEKPIIEEMNGLTNSKADNARYEKLKGERNAIYKAAVPSLERAISTGSKEENLELMKTLASIYSTLGEDAKYKAIKAKIDGM